ncbi:MAG: DinB family protein [Terriglobales bacterium]
MPDLNDTITSNLTTRYAKLATWMHELAAPLTNEQFWTKPFPFGNSFGHLALRLTGNLNYYIGAQMAGTGYVRDRPKEFSEISRPAKEEVLKKFDDAIEIALRSIRSQSAEGWSTPYTATGVDAKTNFEIVLQCATHLHYHMGQMIYLTFEFQRA